MPNEKDPEIPEENEESKEECDPETGTKPASKSQVRSFKERIEEETKEREKPENIEEALEEARSRVKTIEMPINPWWIIGGYCLIVLVITFLLALLASYWIVKATSGIFGVEQSVLIPFAMAAITAIGGLAILIVQKFDMLFAQVGSGEAGVRRWFNTPVHNVVDGKKDYTPLATGLVASPWPFYSTNSYKLDQQTFDIKPHTIPVQSLTVECEPEEGDEEAGRHTNVMEPDDENQGSTVEFKGKFTLAPDERDFRSLILFNDFTEGMSKIGPRIEEAIARAVQFYFSGPEGPANQAQALGIGEFVFRILRALIVVDLATSGVVMLSLAPDIKPPKEQLDAVAQANAQKAEKVRDRRNATSLMETVAIIASGNPEIDDEGIRKTLKDMKFDPDGLLFMAARANKTLSDGDKNPLKKIVTNDPDAKLLTKIGTLLTDKEENND